MAIDFEQIKTYIYDWAVSNLPSGVEVIMYNQNAPRPTTPYVTLFFQNLLQIGNDYIPKPTVDSGLVEQVGDREFTVQIQTYGDDCFTRLENLRSSLQKTSVLDSLRANGIAFVQQFPIQDITELLSSRFENRAQMDILFRTAQNYNDTLGTIATVEIDETISNGVSEVYDETLTISILP